MVSCRNILAIASLFVVFSAVSSAPAEPKVVKDVETDASNGGIYTSGNGYQNSQSAEQTAAAAHTDYGTVQAGTSEFTATYDGTGAGSDVSGGTCNECQFGHASSGAGTYGDAYGQGQTYANANGHDAVADSSSSGQANTYGDSNTYAGGNVSSGNKEV